MEQSMEMEGGGRLTARQEGPRVRFHARRPADERGLYKVWLHGDRGGKLLLGTLVPEGDTLVLTRSISLSELERAGCWPQPRAQCALTFPFDGGHRAEDWSCEERPGRLMADPVLRSAAPGPMLCRRRADGFSLSAPFRPGCPFPLTPLFCLARPERRGGQLRLVWEFDLEGAPRPPRRNL